MKYNAIFTAFLLSSILLISSCKNSDVKKTSDTETKTTTTDKAPAVISDFRSYPQYVSCKINGHPYVSTQVLNAVNLPSRQDFSTRENQEQINGETKISEMNISFFTLPKKPEGILTSIKDFYMTGYTMFPEGGKLERVGFEVKEGQQLTLTSSKDGVLEGTFSFDGVTGTNNEQIVKVTEGVFKVKTEGKTNLKYDKNGDVNMDSLLKSLN